MKRDSSESLFTTMMTSVNGNSGFQKTLFTHLFQATEF